MGLLFGYTLLGATWVVMKTEGDLQAWARGRATIALYGVLAFIAMVSVWTPLLHEEIASRWFSLPNLLYFAVVPVITGVIAWATWRGLRRDSDYVPFIGAMGLFAMCYLGLAISLFPYVVPYTYTLWQAAAAPIDADVPAGRHAVPAADYLHVHRLVILCVSRQGHRARWLPLNTASP